MPANPFLVWLTCVLAACVVVLSVIRAPAMDAPPCEQIRQHAKKYTLQQIKDMAKRAGLSDEEFTALMRCIGPKK